MKKIATLILSLLAFAAVASAQSKALGIRIGGDGEVSYQHWLGKNFVEADLGIGFAHKGVQLSGIYDFAIFNKKGFCFYAGPGAQFTFINSTNVDSKVSLGIGGQMGFEYDFAQIPLNIGLDWRPMWLFGSNRSAWSSIALSFRYRF